MDAGLLRKLKELAGAVRRSWGLPLGSCARPGNVRGALGDARTAAEVDVAPDSEVNRICGPAMDSEVE